MLPVVVLVGRPNVGKSTLFNCLTKTKDALVADFPGLTRDRQYGIVNYDDHTFMIVDTGGIGVEDDDIDDLMIKQSKRALDEADLILFMVDARAGLLPLDETIISELRKLNKPIVLVVNKTDGLREEYASLDFQQMAIQREVSIAASHRRNISELSDLICELLPASLNPPIEDDVKDGIKIAFVGRPNVGKSTLINRLLGEERVVVYDMPGTTRDSVKIPFEVDGVKYQLIDTAGVRRRARVDAMIEKFSIVKTLQSVRESNVCLLLIDAKEGLTDQDLHLLGMVIDSGKALVILVNKWDGLEESHRQHVKDSLHRRLQFVRYAKIKYISALHGSGVGLLIEDINQAYKAANVDLSTPQLTRLLQSFVEAHEPPLVNGRRVKMRYAHAGGHNPPIIVIHGNQVKHLPDSYVRYLTNEFINALNMVGSPLKIELKSGENPFKDKRNTLTPRQLHRKKKMMRFVKKK